MKALLISPEERKISVVHYELDAHGDSDVVREVLGVFFQHEEAFENGDTLYSVEDIEKDTNRLAIEIEGLEHLVFGRLLIVGYHKVYSHLVNVRETVKGIKAKLHFYDEAETTALRSGCSYDALMNAAI